VGSASDARVAHSVGVVAHNSRSHVSICGPGALTYLKEAFAITKKEGGAPQTQRLGQAQRGGVQLLR
jgi:hypothetical protein